MKIILTIIWFIAWVAIGVFIEKELNVEIKQVYSVYGGAMALILAGILEIF